VKLPGQDLSELTVEVILSNGGLFSKIQYGDNKTIVYPLMEVLTKPLFSN